MKQYRLKKDLPGIEAGEVLSWDIWVNKWKFAPNYYPDWFEEVPKEKPKQRKFRVKKDFPHDDGSIFFNLISVGTIISQDPCIDDGYRTEEGLVIPKLPVENNPDWFEEVKEEPQPHKLTFFEKELINKLNRHKENLKLIATITEEEAAIIRAIRASKDITTTENGIRINNATITGGTVKQSEEGK